MDAGHRKARNSTATINTYLRTGKAFCNWPVAAKRFTENPLKHVPLLNANADRRLERHPYSIEELGLLLAAAESGERQYGLTGRERSLVYRLAVETGFRYSEPDQGAFRFHRQPGDGDGPGRCAKNGKDETQPVRETLSAAMRAYLAMHLPRAKAFRMWNDKGVTMIRTDLEAEGVLRGAKTAS